MTLEPCNEIDSTTKEVREGMKARDIRFDRICDECPEQYYAHAKDGQRVGYVRVRFGWCKAWCPDESSEEIVYKARLTHGWWGFATPWERRRHLMKARVAIAHWWNHQ